MGQQFGIGDRPVAIAVRSPSQPVEQGLREHTAVRGFPDVLARTGGCPDRSGNSGGGERERGQSLRRDSGQRYAPRPGRIVAGEGGVDNDRDFTIRDECEDIRDGILGDSSEGAVGIVAQKRSLDPTFAILDLRAHAGKIEQDAVARFGLAHEAVDQGRHDIGGAGVAVAQQRNRSGRKSEVAGQPAGNVGGILRRGLQDGRIRQGGVIADADDKGAVLCDGGRRSEQDANAKGCPDMVSDLFHTAVLAA